MDRKYEYLALLDNDTIDHCFVDSLQWNMDTFKTPPAFKFLIIPFLSWLVILIILLIAKRQLRKGNKQI